MPSGDFKLTEAPLMGGAALSVSTRHLDESTGVRGITPPGAGCPGFTAGGAGCWSKAGVDPGPVTGASGSALPGVPTAVADLQPGETVRTMRAAMDRGRRNLASAT